MAELKTKPTAVNPEAFLKKTESGQRLEDSLKIVDLMKKITKEKPKMWGPSIIGFGKYHYKYASGHEGDMCIAGFSPRKQSLTVYILPELLKRARMEKRLGKCKSSVSCLHIKKLSDIDMKVLKELITESVKYVKKQKVVSSLR